MRAFVALALVWVGVGCAARQTDLDFPDREAIYDQPLEEVWPSVRQYFVDARLSFQEDKGSAVLQTEWRQEFGGSKVAGFWHRYLVLGKRETPTKSKLWIIRVTRSANKALSVAGKEVDWGVSRALGGGGPDGAVSVTDDEGWFTLSRGENAIVAESAQGQRDLVLEWKVFRAVAPKLAKKDAPAPRQAVAKAPGAEAAPLLPECGAPIIGLGKQVKPGGMMLLGELHGTQEVPRFITQVACQVAAAGTRVTVGLELPVESQERVTAFLGSEGKEEDWLKLMEAPFWRNPYQDGRSSEAVANMLEQLRRLRAQGLDVAAFAYDHPKQKGQAREDALAATVLEHVKAGPERFYVVVSGNIHPRTAQGLPWDAKYRPMGLLLKQQVKHVVALDVAYDSGSAWICAVDRNGVKNQLDCGIRTAKGKDNGERFFVHVWGKPNEAGYHGVFYVGRVSASAPAVMKGLGRPGAGDNSGFPVRDEGPAVASGFPVWDGGSAVASH